MDEAIVSAEADPDAVTPEAGETDTGETERQGDTPEVEGTAADGGEAPADEAPGEDSADDDGDQSDGASTPRLGPGADLTDDQLQERLAALLFASPDPLSVARLVGLLERPPAARVRDGLKALSARLEESPLPVQLRGIKGGYTLMTVPEMGEVVGRLAKGSPVEKISPAALETLAIVAYRQPVTKAEIEAIRGVQAGPILRSLVDRGLAKVTGRADVPGHPLQYGTTKDFLDRFGLMSLDDLPRDAELAKD